MSCHCFVEVGHASWNTLGFVAAVAGAGVAACTGVVGVEAVDGVQSFRHVTAYLPAQTVFV